MFGPSAARLSGQNPYRTRKSGIFLSVATDCVHKGGQVLLKAGPRLYIGQLTYKNLFTYLCSSKLPFHSEVDTCFFVHYCCSSFSKRSIRSKASYFYLAVKPCSGDLPASDHPPSNSTNLLYFYIAWFDVRYSASTHYVFCDVALLVQQSLRMSGPFLPSPSPLDKE